MSHTVYEQISQLKKDIEQIEAEKVQIKKDIDQVRKASISTFIDQLRQIMIGQRGT